VKTGTTHEELGSADGVLSFIIAVLLLCGRAEDLVAEVSTFLEVGLGREDE
jgi:hypothetical protein